MGTGAGRSSALEVFDETPHFVQGESRACANAAVAGDGSGRALEGIGNALFAGELIKDLANGSGDVGIADTGRDGPDEVGAFAERLGIEAEEREAMAVFVERSGLDSVEFSD